MNQSNARGQNTDPKDRSTADPAEGRDTSDSETSDAAKTQIGDGDPTSTEGSETQEGSDLPATLYQSDYGSQIHVDQDCTTSRAQSLGPVATDDVGGGKLCDACRDRHDIAAQWVPGAPHPCPDAECGRGFQEYIGLIEHIAAKHPERVGGEDPPEPDARLICDGGQEAVPEHVSVSERGFATIYRCDGCGRAGDEPDAIEHGPACDYGSDGEDAMADDLLTGGNTTDDRTAPHPRDTAQILQAVKDDADLGQRNRERIERAMADLLAMADGNIPSDVHRLGPAEPAQEGDR